MQKEILSVDNKGQIVLPAYVREKLKIEKGSKVILIEHEGVIIMKPLKRLSDLAGILKTNENSQKLIRGLRKEWDSRLVEIISNTQKKRRST